MAEITIEPKVTGTVVVPEMRMAPVVISSVNTKDKKINGIRTSDGRFFPLVKSLRNHEALETIVVVGALAVINTSQPRTKRTNEQGVLVDCDPYLVNEVTAIYANVNALAAANLKETMVQTQLKMIAKSAAEHFEKSFNADDIAAKLIKDNLV